MYNGDFVTWMVLGYIFARKEHVFFAQVSEHKLVESFHVWADKAKDCGGV